MPRIVGVDLPEEKIVAVGLTAIYGIGRGNAFDVLREAKVDSAKRVKDLTGEEVARLQKVVEKFPVEGTLRKKVSQNIERLKQIKCYRGLRHIQNLPVRGQRTRSNARTKRGKRRTIGAIRKKDITRFAGKEQKTDEKS